MARNLILTILLAAAVCVGNACVSGHPEAASPSLAWREPLGAPEPPDPALVDTLDRGIQERFKNVRHEDILKGDVGVSRYAALGVRYRGKVRPELKEQQRDLENLSSAGWRTAVYVAGSRYGGRHGTLYGPIVAREESWDLFQDSDGVKELAAEALRTKERVQGAGRGVALEARPVLASEAMCLQCHRRKKLGDPLGAVVYAFRPAPLADLLGLGR